MSEGGGISGTFCQEARTFLATRQKKPHVRKIRVGERQSIAQKGVRTIDARNSQLENGRNAAKSSVRAPGLSLSAILGANRKSPPVQGFGHFPFLQS